MTFYTKDKLIFLFEVAKYITFSMCDPTYKVPNSNVMNNPPAVISTTFTSREQRNQVKRITTSIVDSNRRIEDSQVETDVDNIGSSFGNLHLNHLKFSNGKRMVDSDTDYTSSSDSSYSENKYRIATRKIIDRNKRAKRKAWDLNPDKYKQSIYVNPTPKLETLKNVMRDFKN